VVARHQPCGTGKASGGKVKQFAQWEVAEQETIADVLKSMEAGEGRAEGALRPPTDAARRSSPTSKP
jgi:hypothetical protein